jgi:flagellar hook assembly protein FlgD
VQNNTSPKATMSDVFPNPATDKAEIRFTLPVNGEARIEIVNIYGQVVKVIADETMAAGSHNMTLNTAEMAQGAYLCNLYFGNEVLTKKFVVTK